MIRVMLGPPGVVSIHGEPDFLGLAVFLVRQDEAMRCVVLHVDANQPVLM